MTTYQASEDFHEAGRHALTRREIHILQLLASDTQPEIIAAHVCIRPKTLKNMQSRIYRKLGASSRCGAVIRGLQHHIITLPPEDTSWPPPRSPSPSPSTPSAPPASG